MQLNSTLQWAERLILLTPIMVVATASLAHAEFEIQESQLEKGEIELEYRGAVHWGFDNQEASGAALDEEEEGALRQSHDFEFQWTFADRWMISSTLVADQPIGDDFNVSALEAGLQYEMIAREGNGMGLAFQAEYGLATRGGEADEVEFGPIVELASDRLLITLNPLFTAQVGDQATTDSLGFQYGWRAEYDFVKHCGIGVEMFGEIEDLANAGSFNDQNHSIGPTLFYKHGGKESEAEGGGNEHIAPGVPETEFSLNLGVQFGLTDVSSDTALKFQGSLAF